IQDRISRARMAGDPPDIALLPKVGDIGLAEFHRADEAIRSGYDETMARLGELERMQKLVF
ncbi:Patatin, partial [Phyllobacterium sp. 0TCS1.6C]|nr:Patatin [Phyllobacterium sp. 0TCS1.6C]